MKTLSIVIPCYNEAATLTPCLERVLTLKSRTLALDVIIVNDGSTDGSAELAIALAKQHPQVRCLDLPKNTGKGAAVRMGFAAARGDFVVVQDADLEYDPADLKRLLAPLLNDTADVVLSSRFAGSDVHRVMYYWHSVGNRVLTTLSNMCTDLNLTDMESGYKIFSRAIVQELLPRLTSDRFGFEPEVVAHCGRLAKQGHCRIYEVGVSYRGRTYAEGKKIGVRDGVAAVWSILKYNLWT